MDIQKVAAELDMTQMYQLDRQVLANIKSKNILEQSLRTSEDIAHEKKPGEHSCVCLCVCVCVCVCV
jgi:hypothetical protein